MEAKECALHSLQLAAALANLIGCPPSWTVPSG